VTTRALLPGVGAFLRGLVYVWLALPAAIVVASSFSRTTYLTFPPKGFTFIWYERAFESEAFMASLLVSTELAVAATGITLAAALPAAFAIDRHRFAGRALLQAGLMSPMIVPVIVLAIGLLQLLTWLGLAGSFLGLLIGHAVITLPYAVRTIGASLSLFDRSLEEAAASLRATPLQVVRWVTLPVLLPGILSAAIFCFVTSFGNVTLSMFLAKSGQTTLPVQIFTYVEHSYDPIVAAVSTLVIAVTLAVIAAIEKAVGLEQAF